MSIVTTVAPSQLLLSSCSIFQDGSRRHLGFSNFGNFNAGTLNMAKCLNVRQILSKSVKLRPRYGDFSILQDDDRRHLGFSNFRKF